MVGVGGDVADLCRKKRKRFLTRPAYLLMHARRPREHLFIHPIASAVTVNNTDAFANRVENERRLLADERTFQRQKIIGIGEDGKKAIFAEMLDRIINI